MFFREIRVRGRGDELASARRICVERALESSQKGNSGGLGGQQFGTGEVYIDKNDRVNKAGKLVREVDSLAG